MDSDSLIRLANYARLRRSRSDVYQGEEYEGEEEQEPEYLCPLCTEEFDVAGLCGHIDEEHAIEAKNGVCPVCRRKVGSDLICHLTSRHSSLLKVRKRRRLHKGGSNSPFSIFKKELSGGNLQSLLGGSSFIVPSSSTEPDPLLTSFIYNPPLADEPYSDQPPSSVEACSTAETSLEDSVSYHTMLVEFYREAESFNILDCPKKILRRRLKDANLSKGL